MTAIVLRGDARSLPLPDQSVDLICTSPPYFSLRDYRDGGESMAGQIGSESTPAEYVASLLKCTREWIRVLKPAGSIFVVLGDKYAQPGKGERNMQGVGGSIVHKVGAAQSNRSARDVSYDGLPGKCLMGLPWRYALGCTDQLGLILRAEICWSKVNGLPESVTDRVRRSHELILHFTKQPRYFSAVDDIREAYAPGTAQRYAAGYNSRAIDGKRLGIGVTLGGDKYDENPLGKLPGSVWDIPSQPLAVPAALGVDHFAAFPMELPRRIILGWSPAAVCSACGEGRHPVAAALRMLDGQPVGGTWDTAPHGHSLGPQGVGHWRYETRRNLLGYACACTPSFDTPAVGTTQRRGYNPGPDGYNPQGTYGRKQAGEYERVGPQRVYDFTAWTPPPTRPALIVDPFGGTGTTALVADMLGRTGVSIDRSADYCRLEQWRTTDPAERARALGVPKPPPVMDGQLDLFGGVA